MSADCSSRLWPTLVAVAGSLGACAGIGDSTRGALSALTPYRVEVQQGNFVSSEQVAALKPGMTRQEVSEVLGTSSGERHIPWRSLGLCVHPAASGRFAPVVRLTVFCNDSIVSKAIPGLPRRGSSI